MRCAALAWWCWAACTRGRRARWCQLAAGGELAPEALGAFLPQEKPLGAPQLGALSGMWAALKAEDAPLRALVNGRLVGVPEHFYDPWLLRAIPRTGSFQAAVAIGRALAAVPGVGDAVFVQRLQALLAAGALRMVQPGADGHFYGAVLAVQDEAKLRAAPDAPLPRGTKAAPCARGPMGRRPVCSPRRAAAVRLTQSRYKAV